MANMDFKEIGRRLREVRGKIKQKEWAEAIGCQQAYVSQVENGITKPSLDYLVKASQITGVSIDEILGVQKEKVISNNAIYTSMQIKDGAEPYVIKKEELVKSITNLLRELSVEKLDALYTLLKFKGRNT